MLYAPEAPSLGAMTMSVNLQEGFIITRDAHAALLDLKNLVDSAEEKIRVAERESIGAAIGRTKGDNPLKTLRDAAEQLQSPSFETAVALARDKMQSAVKWHLEGQKA
jgi:hypothetical protein